MMRLLKQAAACVQTHKKPGLRLAIGDVLFERDRLEMAAVDKLLEPFTRRRTKARGKFKRSRAG